MSNSYPNRRGDSDTIGNWIISIREPNDVSPRYVWNGSRTSRMPSSSIGLVLLILIGANASGKSNIRDAFRFLHGISRGYSLADIIGEKYGEGGERIWSGIRGGAREITFSGNRTFVLTSQSIVPSGVQPFGHDHDYGGESLHYQIGVEIKQKELIPQVMLESLDICDGVNLFLSRPKDRHYHQAKLYNTSKTFKPIGPYTLPRTIPFLGQMPVELRNWPFGSQFVTINGSRERYLYLADHFFF